MTTVIDCAWLDERIARKKALIVAYENAIEALAAGAQSYSLDTGQTRQTVTRSSLGTLRLALQQFENDLSVLDARRNGGSLYVRPTF